MNTNTNEKQKQQIFYAKVLLDQILVKHFNGCILHDTVLDCIRAQLPDTLVLQTLAFLADEYRVGFSTENWNWILPYCPQKITFSTEERSAVLQSPFPSETAIQLYNRVIQYYRKSIGNTPAEESCNHS